MPLYRVSLIYQFGKKGWQENFWCEAATAKAAMHFTPAQRKAILQFRPHGTQLQAVKAFLHKNPRDGAVESYSETVVGSIDQSTPDLVTTAALIGLTTDVGRERKMLLRAWRDGFTLMKEGGSSDYTGVVKDHIFEYVAALKRTASTGPKLGLGYLTPATAAGTSMGKFRVSQFNQNLDGTVDAVLSPSDWTLLFSGQSGDFLGGKADVVFNGQNLREFPGLKGTVRVIKAVSPTITFAYTLCGGATTHAAHNVFVRNAIILFSPFDNFRFVEWRSRQTGRPIGLSRGRGRSIYRRVI